ncbi:MAG: hypothetical protein R3F11_15840 [Verrucomicrobiales bacterium]
MPAAPPILLLPTDDYRRTAIVDPGKVPEGLDALVHRGWGALRRLRHGGAKRLREEAEAVGAVAATLRDESDEARVRGCARRERARLGRIADGSDEAGAALAAVAEAARRKVRPPPYPEQIMAALALGRGRLAEMATGEGKTLAIALAAAMLGWRRDPCHVITANDYLPGDAKSLASFYEFCGFTVAHVVAGMEPDGARTTAPTSSIRLPRNCSPISCATGSNSAR